MAGAAVFFCVPNNIHAATVSREGKNEKDEKTLAFLGECGMLYVENDFRKFGVISNYII